jgi:hypothetical protein
MKFEQTDILVLGDSFCRFRNSDSHWPFIISQKLSNSSSQTRGHGFSGTSWWSVRTRFLKELEISVPKILICCHTSPDRIPNDDDVGLNWATLRNNEIFGNGEFLNKDKQQKIIIASKLYFQELWSKGFCAWAQLAWFKELDKLIEFYKIPYTIHLMCFDHCPEYIFQNGITVEEKLYSIAGDDYNNGSNPNHFTEELNKKIGNRLVDLLLNYQVGQQKLAI